MKDYETINFNEMSVAMAYFKKQKETDKWARVYTNELEIKPVERNPIVANPYVNKNYKRDKGLEDLSDELLSETMQTMPFCVKLPFENRYALYPLRYTGYKTLQDRSGMTGNSFTLFKETGSQEFLSSEEKSLCFNIGIQRHKDKTLCLIRDNKISALLSGDESDYSIMPVYDLLEALDDKMTELFQGYKYRYGTTSHELSYFDFCVEDPEIQKRIIDVLNQCKLNIQRASTIIRFTTSDIGTGGANVYPMISANNRLISIGKPISLDHKHHHNSNDFRRVLDEMLILFRNSVKKIESLKDFKISHVSGCLKSVACSLDLPKKAAIKAAERIKTEYPNGCTALDIYWYLNEIIYINEKQQKTSGKEITPIMRLDNQNKIAKGLTIDYSEHDEEFDWKKQ